jgi:hypothetical protein
MDIGVRVELIGYAETGIKRSTDAALRAFERALVKGYPPITGVSQLPAGATVSTRQQFRWILTIADQPMIEKSREAEVINNKRGLALKVIAPPGVSDLDAVAHVAALRARTTEAFVKVSVIPSGGSDADAVDVAPIAFKD